MVLHGQVSGIEIPATDVARAAKFYSETFGWKFQAPSAEISASEMQAFTAPGGNMPDEGVVAKVEEIPKVGAAKIYINVDDMQAAIDVSLESPSGQDLVFSRVNALK
ncbi:Glyoxylase-like domain-containing protein [Neocucurbitaria cava]|uniref:Glyoxylase-like domain-containing protein n=1 Tax=Neocucurbitaria cava TaxID=798079 RepID=A0A9W8XZL8_9PLEO|nr:Glyoxylase-like domain-containing protein [Neocucurbitaria cava]